MNNPETIDPQDIKTQVESAYEKALDDIDITTEMDTLRNLANLANHDTISVKEDHKEIGMSISAIGYAAPKYKTDCLELAFLFTHRVNSAGIPLNPETLNQVYENFQWLDFIGESAGTVPAFLMQNLDLTSISGKSTFENIGLTPELLDKLQIDFVTFKPSEYIAKNLIEQKITLQQIDSKFKAIENKEVLGLALPEILKGNSYGLLLNAFVRNLKFENQADWDFILEDLIPSSSSNGKFKVIFIDGHGWDGALGEQIGGDEISYENIIKRFESDYQLIVFGNCHNPNYQFPISTKAYIVHQEGENSASQGVAILLPPDNSK